MCAILPCRDLLFGSIYDTFGSEDNLSKAVFLEQLCEHIQEKRVQHLRPLISKDFIGGYYCLYSHIHIDNHSIWLYDIILYRRKYWQSLNLAVWPQTELKKYWRNLNLEVVPHSVLRHHKHCTRAFIRECCCPLIWGTWTKPWVCRFTRNITGSLLAPS